jgi:hypothetical protein
MLNHARDLVERRQKLGGKRRLYAPEIRWSKWIYSGGDYDDGPVIDKKPVDDKVKRTRSKESSSTVRERPSDLEDANAARQTRSPVKKGFLKRREDREDDSLPLSLRLRGRAADYMEWAQHSEDLSYAIKLTVAAWLVTWPAFVPSLNSWYSDFRGSTFWHSRVILHTDQLYLAWAPLQLIFVFEVAIGSSIMSFLVRAMGTTLGSLWGWAAFEAQDGNPYVCVVMLFMGLIPAVYVQLATEQAKAGMVAIINMSIVALSTELQTLPGSGRYDLEFHRKD